MAAALLLSGCFGAGPAPTDTGDPVPGGTEARELPDGFSWNHVPDGTFEINETGSRLLEHGPYDVLEPEVVHVDSPLGGSPTELIVVRPDVPEGTTVPVILTSTPYAPPLDAEYLLDMKTYKRFGEQMVPHGYAYALHSARGYGGSGGCPDMLGPNEAADLDAAITWLGTQAWSSGKVGVVGISYDGGTAWLAAAIGNPHVRTIVPIAGLADYFQVAYKNGTAGIYGQGLLEVRMYHVSYIENEPEYVPFPLWAEHAACPNIPRASAAQAYSQETGERDPDGFWAERDTRQRVASGYDGSVFAVHAFNDWNTGSTQTLPWAADLDVPTKLWLGWWGHEVPGDPDQGGCPSSCVPMELVRWDWSEVLKNWFDRWLKDDLSVDLGPPVQVADINGQWRSDATWPPANATEVRFHLGTGGTLTTAEADPGSVELHDSHVACTMRLCPPEVDDAVQSTDEQLGCSSCPTFHTQALGEPLFVSGMPRVHVTVIPTASDGVISATLSMTVDGTTTEIGWGIIDLRFAAGGETGQPVVPSEPLLVRLALDATEVHVPAGAELGLTLHQSGYHQWTQAGSSPPLEVVLGEGASVLKLDSFRPSPDRLFEPPGATATRSSP